MVHPNDPYPFYDYSDEALISHYHASIDSIESPSTRNTFYLGKQSLVSRRSTVSFHAPMKLGNLGTGISRCSSAPGVLLVKTLNTPDDCGVGHARTMAGFLKVPSSHGLDEDDTGSKINHLRLSGENKRHLQLRGMSFRSTSTNSLHLDAAAVAEPGTRPDAVRRKLGLRIDTNVASCCTRRPDDGASLTPVEVQAVGPLVHLYNNRHYDNIVSPSAAGPSDTAVPFTGDNNLDPGVRPVLRRQRTWISLLLHREDEVQETNVLRKSRSVYGALCHVSATSNTTGGADQPSVLKKKPSLFFRLLNGAETFVDDKPSSYGCENVPKLGVSHWTGNLSTRMSLLYTPCGGYNPELVNEVGRYFGSNAVRQQLLLAAIKPKQSVFIHHPINLYILVSRQRKQETESKCRGNGLPKGKRSYMSLRNSRLSSASYMRTINRHGENWKLFEFSKVSGVPIGEGELCHSDFKLEVEPRTFSRHASTKNYSSVIGPAEAIPVRKSSKMRAAREVSSMRRTSGSTIEWASSVAEFEGDLGDVHVSGERMLHVDDIAEDRQADHSDLRVESRNSSWGYVDPAQLLRSDIIDEGVPEVDAANGEIAVLGDDDRSVDVADLVSGPDSEDLVVVTEDEDLLPDDLVQDLGGNSGPEEDEEEEEEEEAIRRDQSEDRDLIPGSKDCCGSRCAGHKDSPHEGADCPSECTATGSSCECAHGNDETKNERRNVVVSGQWVEALQMMQEYEDEAVRRSLSKRMSRAVSKSSSCKSGKFMEGYVDRELMEACKLAMMSASVLEGRRRRSGASSKMTLLRHGEDDYADKRFM